MDAVGLDGAGNVDQILVDHGHKGGVVLGCHVAKNLLESALNLAEAGERVAGIVAGGEAYAVDMEEVAPVGQEVVVEAPSGGVALGGGGSEGGCKKMAVVTLIEDVQDRVFIEHQVRPPGLHALAETGLKLLHQRFDAFGDAVDVGARLLGVAHVLAPDGLAGHEGIPQRGAFEFHPLGQERVRVGELRDGVQEGAALRSEEHPYIYCTDNYVLQLVGIFSSERRFLVGQALGLRRPLRPPLFGCGYRKWG